MAGKMQDWETIINSEMECRCRAKGCSNIIPYLEKEGVVDGLCWRCRALIVKKLK